MKVAVYCSSRADLDREYEDLAFLLGSWIGQHQCELFYGGVNAGLMHSVAQSAHDSGAKVVGVVPEVFSHRVDELCDEVIFSADLNDRKAKMISIADVFVVLPGGIGTIDEWISTLSHIVVMQSKEPNYDKPILVVNLNGIYDSLIQQIATTSSSVFARGKGIECSIIVSNGDELSNQLDNIISMFEK